jgi:hypothetical protein
MGRRRSIPETPSNRGRLVLGSRRDPNSRYAGYGRRTSLLTSPDGTVPQVGFSFGPGAEATFEAAIAEMEATPPSPTTGLARCQYEALPFHYTWPLGVVRLGRLLRERTRTRLNGAVGIGKPSRYQPGDWVRVKDEAAVRATLGPQDRLRGLWFTGKQWEYCGGTFQVERVVQRMMDDTFRMRSISRTVTLKGATCGDHCTRACPLLFRDEWLEPSFADDATIQLEPTQHVVVKSIDEIRATLDPDGRFEGVSVFPGMERFCGGRYGVVRKVQPKSLPKWKQFRGDWYVLEGVRCNGEPLAAEGRCDRQCSLLWHRTWLEFQ